MFYGESNPELDQKFLEQLNANERSWFTGDDERPKDIKKVATVTALILGGYLLYSWLKAR